MAKPETLPRELWNVLTTARPREPVVVVLAGLPGLGKSTAADWLRKGSGRAAVMESDQIWELVCPYGYDRNFGATGYLVMTTLAGAWLGQGIDVIVDSTAVTVKHRRRFVDVTATVAGFGAPPRIGPARAYCLFFPPDVAESIRRRSGVSNVRMLDHGLKDERVPEASIRSMAERWEAPSVDEGFDAVFEMPPVGS